MATANIDTVAMRAVAADLEPDRTVAAALAPAAAQPSLMTLAAFAAELRNIPRVVREPMMGEIRLQWWRDALDALERGAATGNPVADALGVIMRTHTLPKGVLLGVIDGRATDIHPAPWQDQDAQRLVLHKTEGALFWLAARILGAPPGDAAIRAAAESAGLAYGVGRTLFELPLALSRGQVPLAQPNPEGPEEFRQSLANGTLSPALTAILDRAVSDGYKKLFQARQQITKLSSAHIAAFLPLVMVEPYLKGVLRTGRNPLRDVAEVAPLTRVWRIGRAAWLRRI